MVVGGGMLELRVGERRVQTPGLGKLVTGSLYRHGKIIRSIEQMPELIKYLIVKSNIDTIK